MDQHQRWRARRLPGFCPMQAKALDLAEVVAHFRHWLSSFVSAVQALRPSRYNSEVRVRCKVFNH